MPGFLIVLAPEPGVSRCHFNVLQFLVWRISISPLLPHPSLQLRSLMKAQPQGHAVPGLALRENKEGKAGRSRMLSLLSCRSTFLGTTIAQQRAWLSDEWVGRDWAWLAL